MSQGRANQMPDVRRQAPPIRVWALALFLEKVALIKYSVKSPNDNCFGVGQRQTDQRLYTEICNPPFPSVS